MDRRDAPKRCLLNPRGAVLIMVLWVLTILSLIGAYYALDVRIQRNLGQQQWDDISGRAVVKSLLLFLSSRIAPEDMDPEDAMEEGLFVPDGRKYQLEIGGRTLSLRLEDERGKLDLNKAREDQLRELLRGIFQDRDLDFPDTIVDSILDWKDANKLARIHGAEDEVYQKKTPPYRPANAPFTLLEELLLVNGVDHETYFGPLKWQSEDSGKDTPAWEGGLQDLFTIYNGTDTLLESRTSPPLRDILAEDLRPSMKGPVVYRLNVSWGTRSYQVFWAPDPGDKNFRLIHWTEMLSSRN